MKKKNILGCCGINVGKEKGTNTKKKEKAAEVKTVAAKL